MDFANLFKDEIESYIDLANLPVLGQIQVQFVPVTDNGVWGSCRYFARDGQVTNTLPTITVNHGIFKVAPEIVRKIIIPHEFAHAAQWANSCMPSHDRQFYSYAKLFGGDRATKVNLADLVGSGFVTAKEVNIIGLLTGKQEKFLIRNNQTGKVEVVTKNYWTRLTKTYPNAKALYKVIGSNRNPDSVSAYYFTPDE